MSEPRKCDVCKENRATVHLTQVIKGTFRRSHLCQSCNEHQDPITPELLQSMVPPGMAGAGAGKPLQLAVQLAAGKMAGAADAPASGVVCDTCGLTYEEFKSHGRFGCAEDYEVFADSLESILEKIHGATMHVGRVPPTTDGATAAQVQARNLEAKLAVAVANEDYEVAARLRDEIEQLRSENAGGKSRSGESGIRPGGGDLDGTR